MEDLIIKNCSPVLGGLKTGSLFNCSAEPNMLKAQINSLNQKLSQKGVFIYILKTTPKFSLIYVCRKTGLMKDMDNIEVKSFLRKIGYTSFHFDDLIETLMRRFSQDAAFPHEIGLFLSYPIEDVIGFIKNKGNNFKLCGYWKVYSDEKYAEKLFSRYTRCTEVYTRLFNSLERNIEELTIAI
ncbi:MAG: DUF3793 family protein [Clostridiales bacterium]|nr:DUF3793 family protein [Clostridiales bacterium]